jgi:AraC-like DNA-binding protein
VSPAKYLKTLRMRQAATLLTTTFLSVKEIVRRVGLTDESHFVRDFKRLYGRTPSEYRHKAFLASGANRHESTRENWPMNQKIGQLIILASCALLV